MVSRKMGSLLIGVVVLLLVATETMSMKIQPMPPMINGTSPVTNSTSSATKSTPSTTNMTSSTTPNTTPLVTNSTSIVKSNSSSVTKSVSPVKHITSSVKTSNSTMKPVDKSTQKSTSAKKNSKPADLPLAGQLYEKGFSQAHPELCPAHGAHLRLLVLVTSAPTHAAHRHAVRLTWGHYAARRDVALAFVIGTPLADLRANLTAEDDLYGDIIIGNFIDSYSNLTLKTMSMLEWTATYCERAPRLLKTDDDVFLNIPLLLSFMAKRANDTRTIWGRVHKWPPNRSPKSKYFLTRREFGGRIFPFFATGPAYLLTSDCIAPLLSAVKNKTYLKLEDVFVTGIVAEKLGIKRINAPEFYNRKISPQPCTLRRTIAAHMVNYHQQFEFWQKLLDGRSKC